MEQIVHMRSFIGEENKCFNFVLKAFPNALFLHIINKW